MSSPPPFLDLNQIWFKKIYSVRFDSQVVCTGTKTVYFCPNRNIFSRTLHSDYQGTEHLLYPKVHSVPQGMHSVNINTYILFLDNLFCFSECTIILFFWILVSHRYKSINLTILSRYTCNQARYTFCLIKLILIYVIR